MNSAKNVLKEAFIDSALSECEETQHIFSTAFNKKMNILIKAQRNALYKLNYLSKRVACIILVIVLCLTTVFGVKAVREPIFNAFEKIYVSIKEKLSKTKAKNIAEYFEEDITKIIATNHITSLPKVYIIEDAEKINEFAKLISETYWAEREEDIKDYEILTYSFEFVGSKGVTTTLNLYTGVAELISGNKKTVFNIRDATYYEILAFTTRRYYLHKSDLTLPKKKDCLFWQNKALDGLSETEKQEFCEKFRTLHNHIEWFLLGRVSRLKEPESVYWQVFELERGEAFTDPFTNDSFIDDSYYIILDFFDELSELAKDKELKQMLKTAKADFINAIKNHDIASVFTVHEFIHDYDYYAVNYPVQYKLDPPDWEGIKIYFGRVK